MALEKEQAISILNSKELVSELGVDYTVRVSSVSDVQYPENPNRAPYRIVNLSAITPYHRMKAVDLLKAGEFDKAANQGLTFNVREGIDFIPSKNQLVSIVLGTFVTKDGEEAIGVRSMSPLAKATAKSVDFAALLEEVDNKEPELV